MTLHETHAKSHQALAVKSKVDIIVTKSCALHRAYWADKHVLLPKKMAGAVCLPAATQLVKPEDIV